MSRTLYCSPLGWRLGAFATPFAVFGLGVLLDFELFIYMFWPLALILFVVNFFVRKSLRVELGICPLHQHIRRVLQALSIAAMAAVAFGLFTWQQSMALLWPALAAVVALAMVQPFIGVNAVRLKAIAYEDAWLTGTGKAFHEGLPEAPVDAAA